ncbi:MAG: hypothetical protein IID31_14155 [Planctomycetes bacterium]|nr:hypothetical protein [Planctomycetota bacterium]
MNTDILKTLVRPTVTWALVGAVIAAAFLDIAAFDKLEALALITIGFWFGSRTS